MRDVRRSTVDSLQEMWPNAACYVISASPMHVHARDIHQPLQALRGVRR